MNEDEFNDIMLSQPAPPAGATKTPDPSAATAAPKKPATRLLRFKGGEASVKVDGVGVFQRDGAVMGDRQGQPVPVTRRQGETLIHTGNFEWAEDEPAGWNDAAEYEALAQQERREAMRTPESWAKYQADQGKQ